MSAKETTWLLEKGTEKGEVSKIVPERASWSKPMEFVLSCIGYAVGLGNVWRFPYLCYRNGGGAFLFTYCIMLVIMGMPIFLLELVIGQYSGLGPDQAFSRIAPIFSGLGYCTLVVIFLVTIYYMVIIAWTLFYLFVSFKSELGWSSCSNSFNTIGCYSATEDLKCGPNETFYSRRCYSVNQLCQEHNYMKSINRTYCATIDGTPIHLSHVINRTLASYEYFNDFVLGIRGATWEDFGSLRWDLVFCLFLSWVVGYLCVVKGVKTSGKAVYFTALFPYVVLTALVIRGVTLDGAWEGIELYITPKWEKLLDANMWGNAASQTFYSFGIGCGSLITLASYNDYRNNCLKDVFIVSVANLFTSVYAGFAIFAMLGFLAKQLDVPVEVVATDGPGLAFVAYPEALLRLPYPQIWSVVFFFMLLILGLGSQFAGVEAINTSIIDKWPTLRKHQTKVTLAICCLCFLLGVPMCFQGGVYLFTLLEWNTASWAILLIGLAEVGSVAWAYGCDRFIGHMESMKMKMSKVAYGYWWSSWMIFTPLSCIGVFIFQMATFSTASYEDYQFPLWANSLGWMIGLATLVPMPLFALYTYFKKGYSHAQVILQSRSCFDMSFSVLPNVSASLQALWSDRGVRLAVYRGFEYELNDSALYLFENMDRICDTKYVPSPTDVLRARVRTQGVIETHFKINDVVVSMFDVGGQRSQRRKWIYCFDDVRAVLFVVSLSGYDMTLLEDATVNRLEESLNLFGQIVNNPFFRNASFVLLLNKFDLFREKILHSDRHLRFYFPDYKGPDKDVDRSALFIQHKFVLRNNNSRKVLYPHFTTATDTANVQVVFQSIMEMVISENLGQVTLL